MKAPWHESGLGRKAFWMAAAVLVCVASPAQRLTPPALAQTVNTDALSKASNSKDKKVDIEADRMEVLDKENKAIFTGKVDAKRADVTLHTDKLVVDYEKGSKTDTATKTDNSNNSNADNKTKVTFLNATGHVVIITAKQRITGERARMDVKANKLVVSGNVVVTQDTTVMRGNELHVDLNTHESQLTGGRVRGSFVPKGQ